jgi:hypothetical protein
MTVEFLSSEIMRLQHGLISLVDSLFGSLHHVDVGSVTDVSEVLTASIFRK